MTASAPDQLLREASVLKMRAMRLTALGDHEDRWQAIMLLHEAAGKELAAAAALPEPSEQEQIGALIEACGLFLDACDPVRAIEQWACLPQWVFTSDAGAALLARLKPLYREKITAFNDAWRALGEAPGVPPPVATVPEDRLRDLLSAFPGVAELWWALSLRTSDAEEAEDARRRATQLDPGLTQDEAGERAWARIEQTLVCKLKVELRAERAGTLLLLDLVSRVAAAFGDLLSHFVEETFAGPGDLVPSGASVGSFILDVVAQGVPPYALDALDQALNDAPERVGAHRLTALLTLLQQSGVRLAASILPSDTDARGAEPTKLVIDAKRRKSLLRVAEAAARRTLDSRDVPQANDLPRVFRIVEMVANQEDLDPQALGITRRQVDYYRRAAKILGFLTESDELTAAGRLIARFGTIQDRLRYTVALFEESACGGAWIRWSKGKRLLDVDPDSATEFLQQSVPDLTGDTPRRRAQTLIAWYRTLIDYYDR